MQEGYDHSYFFIASFIDQHLNFHAQSLFSWSWILDSNPIDAGVLSASNE
jgi:hypothetical protein